MFKGISARMACMAMFMVRAHSLVADVTAWHVHLIKYDLCIEQQFLYPAA